MEEPVAVDGAVVMHLPRRRSERSVLGSDAAEEAAAPIRARRLRAAGDEDGRGAVEERIARAGNIFHRPPPLAARYPAADPHNLSAVQFYVVAGVLPRERRDGR
jgi:hypothetical protein